MFCREKIFQSGGYSQNLSLENVNFIQLRDHPVTVCTNFALLGLFLSEFARRYVSTTRKKEKKKEAKAKEGSGYL